MTIDLDPLLTITQTFAAPREQLYDAWLNPDIRMKWWGVTAAHRCTQCSIDARAGCRYQMNMMIGDKEFLFVGAFEELDRPEKQAFTWRIEGIDESDSLVTLLFAEKDAGQTELTLIHDKLSSIEDRDQTRIGWDGCLSRLAAEVAAWG